DLPIVGGSILSHDHYQGGRHTFPMAVAEIERVIELNEYPTVTAGIVKWPMSVIRLQGKNQNEMIEAANHIFEKWQNYSDTALNIVAKTADGVQHHTLTPIARRKEGIFELDLVLRDNNVSAEFPEGIFHPHRDVQHIKKENIGLIEVMGLAILPPRLAAELEEVANYLLDEENTIADYHKSWADQLKETHEITRENAMAIIQQSVGDIFTRVLEDAGVYKRDVEGQAGFTRFIETL
ncbi:MAG: UDP-glucose--hexose-1-phosphate uridylyltransferase, partial [Enterococcus sp.]